VALVRGLRGLRGQVRVEVLTDRPEDRFTAGAAWDDMALEFAHFRDWQRCALVTDVDWVRHSAKAFGWLMGGRLRVFDIDELKAALEWAASDD